MPRLVFYPVFAVRHGGNVQVLADSTGLTDKGYAGAGIALVPIEGTNLAPDNQTRNRTINALRAPAMNGQPGWA